MVYKVAAPHEDADGLAWSCTVVCDSPHFKKTMAAHGADSMQALHLGIQLGALLAHEATYYCDIDEDSFPTEP